LNDNDPASAFTATIDWGDGSATAAGTIVSLGGGQFRVAAPAHTFAQAGTFTLRVTVDDIDLSTGIGISLAAVAPAPPPPPPPTAPMRSRPPPPLRAACRAASCR